jgi:hypothetical protein
MAQAQPPERTLPAVVSSNGVDIRFDDQLFVPMHDSTDQLDDPGELRHNFERDGYLLLRGALDRDAALDLRGRYFALFPPVLLAPGTSPVDGVFSGTAPAGLPDYGTRGHPAYEFVRTPEFDAFTRRPELAAIAESILGGPVDLTPRRILRHFDNRSGRASRAHVDYDYMDHGSDQLVTAWITLGDCPIECGGLIYLERSHGVERDQLDALRSFTDRPGDHRPVSNDLGRTASILGRRWVWTDYRAGDVVLHSPHTVHASLDNLSDVMRLSADVRFRRSGTPADERWSGDWSADDGF